MSKKEDSLFQQDGKYCITVHHGAEKIGRWVVKAKTYGLAIQKIVKETLDDYPEAYDYDSEIRFVRELFDEIK